MYTVCRVLHSSALSTMVLFSTWFSMTHLRPFSSAHFGVFTALLAAGPEGAGAAAAALEVVAGTCSHAQSEIIN